jgi:hypothetical protein
MGTPYYMSPEQARGERNLDGRVDVYACGVMMYEALVGKRPFLAPNYNALLLAIINTTPKPIREIRPATPPALEAIVMHSMAKARDDRYPSANAVLRDIQALPIAVHATGGMRMPAPPTAAERMRAPVLGGRADPRQDPRQTTREEAAARSTRGGGRQHAENTAGAGATLRSRMAEPQHQPASVARASHEQENATRLDIKPFDPNAPGGSRSRRLARSEESDSIDIPIHITGSDLVPVQAAGAAAAPPAARGTGAREYVDDMPTEVFRPGVHMSPPKPMAARSPSATRVAPAPRPAAGAPPAPPAPPSSMAPANLSGLVGDDWDGETVVKKPAALTTSRHRDRPNKDSRPVQAQRSPAHAQHAPPQPQPAANQPFNPDETVNLRDGDIEVEVDFDETHHIVSPQRRRT